MFQIARVDMIKNRADNQTIWEVMKSWKPPEFATLKNAKKAHMAKLEFYL